MQANNAVRLDAIGEMRNARWALLPSGTSKAALGACCHDVSHPSKTEHIAVSHRGIYHDYFSPEAHPTLQPSCNSIG